MGLTQTGPINQLITITDITLHALGTYKRVIWDWWIWFNFISLTDWSHYLWSYKLLYRAFAFNVRESKNRHVFRTFLYWHPRPSCWRTLFKFHFFKFHLFSTYSHSKEVDLLQSIFIKKTSQSNFCLSVFLSIIPFFLNFSILFCCWLFSA